MVFAALCGFDSKAKPKGCRVLLCPRFAFRNMHETKSSQSCSGRACQKAKCSNKSDVAASRVFKRQHETADSRLGKPTVRTLLAITLLRDMTTLLAGLYHMSVEKRLCRSIATVFWHESAETHSNIGVFLLNETGGNLLLSSATAGR